VLREAFDNRLDVEREFDHEITKGSGLAIRQLTIAALPNSTPSELGIAA
jgi:hypothetical protein